MGPSHGEEGLVEQTQEHRHFANPANPAGGVVMLPWWSGMLGVRAPGSPGVR